MSDSGVFIDIFARLNMASVSKVLSEMNSTFRRAGEEAGTAFSEGGVSGLRIMQDEFRNLTRVSTESYIEMQRGLADLQVSEARINELRARNFARTSDEMIAAQRRVDESIANTQRLVEASSARSAEARAAAYAPVPMGGGRGDRGLEDEDDRGRGRREPIPVGGGGRGARMGNMLGIGAMVGTVIGGIDVTKQAAQLEDSLNRLVTVAGEQTGNIKMIQDAIAQISTKTGYNPQDLATVALQGEKRGYRGKDLSKLLDVTAQLSREEKIPLEEALQGITITAQNYKIQPDQLADIASQLNVAVGRSGTTMQGFVGALPNIEQRAAAAGISREQIWGVLAQMTKSGLSPERASQNEDNLVRSLSAPNGPARDMINTLFTQAGAKGPDGQPLTDAYIMNNLGKLGITGAVNTVMNQGVLPNLTEGQRVLLPAVFKNEQVQENIESMKAELHSKAALDFANNNKEFTGGMLPGFKIRNTSKNGIGTQLLAEGASPEEIDRLSQMAVQFQNLGGFGQQLKGRDSDVQSITGVLRKAFGTVEASRAAMIIGAGDNPQQAQAQTADTIHAIADAHADANGNVEGFAQSMDTAVSQTDRAKASWHNAANTLGEELTPAVKNVMSGLADFGQWLSEHQGVLDTFAATLGGIAAIWAGDKLVKGIKGFVEPTKNLLGAIGSKAQGAMPNTGIITSGGPPAAAGTAGTAGAVAGAEEAATVLAGGVVTGAGEGAPLLRTAVAEGIAGAATAVTTAGAKAGGEMGEAITIAGGKAAGEMGESITVAGGRAAEEIGVATGRMGQMMGGLGGMLGPMAAIAAGMEVPKADHALQSQKWFQQGTGGGFWQNPLGATTNAFLGAQQWLGQQAGVYNGPVQWGARPDGHALGGIVGYKKGGKIKTADPVSQPLMGVPDMKRDSVLGMLPNGQPIGLRGGEGILTPEAVARLGGESGVHALNDPWADPVKVGTTFYGSFAKGFAKYSKWGKYLEASSQTLDSLEGEREKASGAQGTARSEGTGGKPDKTGWPKGLEGDMKADVRAVNTALGLSGRQYVYGGLDCSGYLSEIYASMAGLPAGRKFSTTSNFSALGFHPGYMPGALNIGVTPRPGMSGHMAGTLPNGVNVESGGSNGGGTKYGHGAHGATDGQFQQQWWYMPGYASGGVVDGSNSDPDVGGNESNIPDWWRKNLDADIPIDNAWMPNNPKNYGPGMPKPPWITPRGFSGGGVVSTGYMSPPPNPPRDSRTGGPYPGGGPGGGLPSNGRDGSWPDWWKNSINEHFDDIPSWMPQYGMYPDGDGPVIGRPDLHPSGKGPMMGFDEGGVVPPGGPQVVTAPKPPTNYHVAQPGKVYQAPKTPQGFQPPMDTGGKPLNVKPGDVPNPQNGLAPWDTGGAPPPRPGAAEGRPTEEGPRPPTGPPKDPLGPLTPAGTQPGNYGTPGGDRNILDNPSREAGMENTSKGFGVGGGVLGMAESAASMAAGAFSGGAGGEASQMAFQLVNRAIGYGGQLAGIAASGLLETFLPNNSPLADPTNSLIGKVALGIAGAHPGGKNTAGDSALQIKPKEGLDQGAKTADGSQVPMIHMDHPEIHNHGQQDWNGMQHAIGQATFGMDIHR